MAVAWQGWLVSLVAVALVAPAVALVRTSPARVPVVILVVAAYAVVALRTRGAQRAKVPSAAAAARSS